MGDEKSVGKCSFLAVPILSRKGNDLVQRPTLAGKQSGGGGLIKGSGQVQWTAEAANCGMLVVVVAAGRGEGEKMEFFLKLVLLNGKFWA